MRQRDTEDVFDLIHSAMHLFRSRQLQGLRESPQALTHMEARVLGFFDRHPGETLSALIAHSGRDKGQLARLVGGLRERGLLEGQPDQKDRRNLRLSLTPEGKEIAAFLAVQQQQLSRHSVQGFSPEEERTLAALLQRLIQNIQ